jgi:hypothetical protein
VLSCLLSYHLIAYLSWVCTSIETSQLASKPANQQAGKPEDELIKATFYLTQDHIMQLERIRLERKLKGIKVDKSALVREAIDLLKA